MERFISTLQQIQLKMQIYCMIIVFYMILTVIANYDTSVCKMAVNSSGPLIPFLPEKFEARMLLILPNNKITKYLTEYNDGTKMEIVKQTFEGGLEDRLYLNEKKQKMVFLDKGQGDKFEGDVPCIAMPFTFSKYNYFIGIPDDRDMKNIHYSHFEGILNYNEGVYLEYVEETTVRTIPAHHWKTCIYVEEVNATLDVHYYWSASKNLPPTAESNILLRVTVDGKVQLDKSMEPKTIKEIYEIVWFEKVKDFDPEIFEMPPALYCANYRERKDFPEIPEKFSMRTEHFTETSEGTKKINIFESLNIWFDVEYELVRMEYQIPTMLDGDETYISNVTILDFKSDIKYIMNQYTAECSIFEINEIGLDSEFSRRHFRTPKDYLFYNLTNYEYKGKYLVRDVLCDVWVGRSEVSTLTVEWSFLDENWSADEAFNVEKRVPVQMVVYFWETLENVKFETRQTVSVFNYRSNPSTFPLDVGNCFSDDQKRHFQVSFPFPDVISNLFLQKFRLQSRYDIAKASRVSPLRIDNVQVDIDENYKHLVLEFTILDLPRVPGVTPNPDEQGLDEAIGNLAYYVDKNSLTINVTEENKIITLTAVPKTLFELDSRSHSCKPPAEVIPAETVAFQASFPAFSSGASKAYAPPSETHNNDKKIHMDKYTSGQLAALAVGMFLVGGTIGILAIVHVLMHFDRKQRQQDRIQLDESPMTEESMAE